VVIRAKKNPPHRIKTNNGNRCKILLGGDSAGANLTSALLLHMAKPHPHVDKIALSSRLRGALLISPWVSFETESPAFTDNAESDYLTPQALNRASAAFIGPAGANDEYSEPIRAPAEWWKEVAATACDEVMVWGGGGEILIDSIRIFANTIAHGFAGADAAYYQVNAAATATAAAVEAAADRKEEGGGAVNGSGGAEAVPRQRVGRERVFYVETPRASHEEQIMNHTLRIPGRAPSASVIEDWVNARL
jgi:acetyl esterase/lipase